MAEPKAIVKLEKNEIRIVCSCHGETLTSTKGQDFLATKELAIVAGKGKTKWCKTEMTWPEVQAKIFDVEPEKEV